MNEVNIEIYTDIFKNEVAELIMRIQNDEFGIPLTLALHPDLNEISKFYQANKGNFWIARFDDRIIGTIALLDIGYNRSALRKMFVASDYRGKPYGIGQKLLDSLINWAKYKRTTEIFLGTTARFIRAQRFYEKNGFMEIPKQTLPKEFPVMDVDVKFYKCFV